MGKQKQLIYITSKFGYFSIAALLLVFQMLSTLILNPQKAEAAIPLSFSLLGTHPGAAAQPTNDGKAINKLQVFDGKLFAAYGDYNANTGPISINPFDLTNNSFDGEAISVSSESLGNWKVINNKLYTTTIDATCSGSCPSGYAVGDTSGNWTMRTPVNAEHMFDIETYNGTDLWLFGGSTETAYAWRSTDGGANWTIAQTNNRDPGSGDDSERYYWGKAAGGKMYMQADVYGQAAALQIYDGTSWTTGTEDKLCENGTASQGTNPVTFNNKLICTSYSGLAIYNPAIENRATSVTPDQNKCSNIRDLFVDGDMLYILCRDQSNVPTILRTTDMQTWQELGGVPSAAFSLAVDPDTGNVYVGTEDSKLYEAAGPANDTTPPTISITSPTTGSSNQSLHFSSNASDNVQLTKVEYYLDDQLVATSKTSPYNASWANRYGNSDWEHHASQSVVTAKAYDFDGNVATSAPVTLDIEDPDLWPESMESIGTLTTRAPNGDLWGIDVRGVIDQSSPIQFVKFDPVTETVTYYPVPEDSPPGFPVASDKLIAAPNGSLWYLSCEDQLVTNYFPETEEVEVYTFDQACSDGAASLVLTPDGTVYNAPLSSEVINKIDPNGNMSEISLPNDQEVYSIGLASNGEIIMSLVAFDEDNNSIGTLARMNQAGDITEYFAPNSDPSSNIFGDTIFMDDAGTTWIGGVGEKELDGFYLASVTESGVVTRFDLAPGIGGRIMTMQLGPDGDLYVMLTNGQVARVNSSGQLSLFSLLTSADPNIFGPEIEGINQSYLGYYAGGLVVDGEGGLWIDDGFGGRLLHVLVAGGSDPSDPDSPNMASLTSAESGASVLLETPEDTEITCSSTTKESSLTVQDPAYSYLMGLVNFCFSTESVDNVVSLTYVTDLKSGDVVARKYNSTNKTFFSISGAQIAETTYQGQHALKLTYTLTDNGLLDLDPTTGSIKDPVGLARLIVGAPNTGFRQ